ncbi:MAG: cytochrome c biogenesis protein ResB [Nitrospirae bacterium]|nr:cytochrome c biogenesis protein ResB [Nitrospirota bacterium]
MIRKAYDILISLKTVFWLFAATLLFMLIGSFALPAELAFFSGIDDEPLFGWLNANANITKTWWIWAIIGAIALLGASTVLCTIDYLLNRLTRSRLLLKLSPQVMHTGALFIMLGHLLTGSYGFKTDVTVSEGKTAAVGNGVEIKLEKMTLKLDELGFASDWSAMISLSGAGSAGASKNIAPSSPVYYGGLGFYFRSVDTPSEADGAPSAVFRVSKDPGAAWALLGATLLAAGGIGFLTARFNLSVKETRPRADGNEALPD